MDPTSNPAIIQQASNKQNHLDAREAFDGACSWTLGYISFYLALEKICFKPFYNSFSGPVGIISLLGGLLSFPPKASQTDISSNAI